MFEFHRPFVRSRRCCLLKIVHLRFWAFCCKHLGIGLYLCHSSSAKQNCKTRNRIVQSIKKSALLTWLSCNRVPGFPLPVWYSAISLLLLEWRNWKCHATRTYRNDRHKISNIFQPLLLNLPLLSLRFWFLWLPFRCMVWSFELPICPTTEHCLSCLNQ